MGHTLRNDMKDELNEQSKIVDAIAPGMQKRAVTGSKVILTLLKKKATKKKHCSGGRSVCSGEAGDSQRTFSVRVSFGSHRLHLSALWHSYSYFSVTAK